MGIRGMGAGGKSLTLFKPVPLEQAGGSDGRFDGLLTQIRYFGMSISMVSKLYSNTTKNEKKRSESFHHLAMANEEILSGKRKHTLASKLSSADNIHEDAVKRRKGTEVQTENATKGSTGNQKSSATTSRYSCQASIEVVDDEDDAPIRHNAGCPKNPDSILEAADGSNDDSQSPQESSSTGAHHSNKDSGGEKGLQEETDEQELGDNKLSYLICTSLTAFQPASKRTGDPLSTPSFAQRWKSSISMNVAPTTLPVLLKTAKGKGEILAWFVVTLTLVTKAPLVVYAGTPYSAGGRKLSKKHVLQRILRQQEMA